MASYSDLGPTRAMVRQTFGTPTTVEAVVEVLRKIAEQSSKVSTVMAARGDKLTQARADAMIAAEVMLLALAENMADALADAADAEARDWLARCRGC